MAKKSAPRYFEKVEEGEKAETRKPKRTFPKKGSAKPDDSADGKVVFEFLAEKCLLPEYHAKFECDKIAIFAETLPEKNRECRRREATGGTTVREEMDGGIE